MIYHMAEIKEREIIVRFAFSTSGRLVSVRYWYSVVELKSSEEGDWV